MLSLSDPEVKLLVSILAIAFVYFKATKISKYSLSGDLLLVTPKIQSLLFWVFIYLIYMLGSDFLFNWRGVWNFQPWKDQCLFISLERVLAVCIFGPIAEELIFRGILLTKLNRLKINKWVCLFIVTALWTVIHVNYSFWILILIFFNGLLLGLSRYYSGSLIIPIILHIIWNLYSVW